MYNYKSRYKMKGLSVYNRKKYKYNFEIQINNKIEY
mgnify:CR=1 FL=1